MQALEERVALLEEELRRLQTQMMRQTGAVSGRTAPDFLDRFSGIFGDDSDVRRSDAPGPLLA